MSIKDIRRQNYNDLNDYHQEKQESCSMEGGFYEAEDEDIISLNIRESFNNNDKVSNTRDDNILSLNKWRLILGRYSNDRIPFSESGNNINYVDMDVLLDYLYSREYGEEDGVRSDKGTKSRQGSLDPSKLTVPTWITKIRELFPKETVEILEKHALEKYELTELLTDKEVLEKLEPNKELLKSIIQMKHLMKGEVLQTAKAIIKKVADEISRSLENDIRRSITGRIDRNKNSLIKNSRNLDMKKTIKANLKNYDINENKLIIDKVYFNDRVKKYNKWNVIIAVDESGSMLDSIIHSAVMAGIFARLPMIKTNLIIFDTEVVDLSSQIDDVVEVLMNVQLGGGTNITKALTYCENLMENPSRTIVVCITDLFEGYSYEAMLTRAKSIVESGAKLVVLTALDFEGSAVYRKDAAMAMAACGAEVAAMTPGGLAEWIAEIIS